MKKLFVIGMLLSLVTFNCIEANGTIFGFELGGPQENAIARMNELGLKLDKKTNGTVVISSTYKGNLKIYKENVKTTGIIVFYKKKLMSILFMFGMNSLDSKRFIDEWQTNLQKEFNVQVVPIQNNYKVDNGNISTECDLGQDGVTRLSAEYQPFLKELQQIYKKKQ